MSEIKAVFFDVGGTLLRPFPSVGHLYAATAEPYGYSYDPAELEQAFHKAWKNRGGLASLGDSTSEDKERSWWYSLVSEVFNVPGKMPEFDRFFEDLYALFEHKSSWEVYPDVLETLEVLKQRQIRLGVISNWDLRLHRVMTNMKLISYFDFLVGSSYIGATKPNPKIFQEALKHAGCRPCECIHVGDSYDEDILGAENSQIRGFLIDRAGTAAGGPMGSKIRSLKEILSVVQKN